MTFVVSLRDVIQGMHDASDETVVCLNRRTGKIVLVFEEDRIDVEDDGSPDDADEFEKEVREVLDPEIGLPLPDQFEIHEWTIMRDFAESLDDAKAANLLGNALHGSGAFRYFKDTAHTLGLIEDWYLFRDAAYERIAIEWLEDNDIPWTRNDPTDDSAE